MLFRPSAPMASGATPTGYAVSVNGEVERKLYTELLLGDETQTLPSWSMVDPCSPLLPEKDTQEVGTPALESSDRLPGGAVEPAFAIHTLSALSMLMSVGPSMK